MEQAQNELSYGGFWSHAAFQTEGGVPGVNLPYCHYRTCGLDAHLYTQHAHGKVGGCGREGVGR